MRLQRELIKLQDWVVAQKLKLVVIFEGRDAAGKGGVPMPNIPQMASVWQDLGAAWFKSTKGAGASKPVNAFKVAARSIADKIG